MKLLLVILSVLLIAITTPVWVILLLISLFSKEMRLRVVYYMLKIRVWYENREIILTQPPYCLLRDKLEFIHVETFMQCAVHGNYELLLMDGKYDEQMAIGAWNQLVLEFTDKLEGRRYGLYKKLRKDVVKARLRYNWVHSLCDALELEYNEDFIKGLKRYGYNLSFTKETIVSDINLVRESEKRTLSFLNNTERELDEKFNSTDKLETEDDYYRAISEIRKFRKYEDSPHQLAKKWTMDTYVLELKLLNEHNIAMEKMREQNKPGKPKRK